MNVHFMNYYCYQVGIFIMIILIILYIRFFYLLHKYFVLNYYLVCGDFRIVHTQVALRGVLFEAWLALVLKVALFLVGSECRVSKGFTWIPYVVMVTWPCTLRGLSEESSAMLTCSGANVNVVS